MEMETDPNWLINHHLLNVRPRTGRLLAIKQCFNMCKWHWRL